MKRVYDRPWFRHLTFASLTLLGASAFVTTGCAGTGDDDVAAPPTPTFELVQVTSQSACQTLACAKYYWDNIHKLCYVTGLRAGCLCYQGEAQACDMNGDICSSSSTSCGVKLCSVTSVGISATSTWGTCQ
jgi:hypothetical protein